MEVQLEDLRGLMLKFEQAARQVDNATDKAVQKAGLAIVSQAQLNIRTAGWQSRTLTTTGRLSNSGRVEKVGFAEVDAGFFATGSEDGTGYAAAVEYGRRAGKFPPLFQLRSWVKKKLRVDEKAINPVAFLVGRKIAKHGTEPHPFFMPAVEKNRDRVAEEVTKALKAIIR